MCANYGFYMEIYLKSRYADGSRWSMSRNVWQGSFAGRSGTSSVALVRRIRRTCAVNKSVDAPAMRGRSNGDAWARTTCPNSDHDWVTSVGRSPSAGSRKGAARSAHHPGPGRAPPRERTHGRPQRHSAPHCWGVLLAGRSSSLLICSRWARTHSRPSSKQRGANSSC